MMPWIAPRFRGLAGWMAAGVCASVALLTWFGYHAIREWQRSSTLLVERRADAAADLLVTALTRDMHAVQKSVLASPDWDAFTLDPPSDVGNMIASAFARYPYPESFFAARGAASAGSVIFFTRSNRPPVWAPDEEAPNRFPVTTSTVPMVAASAPRIKVFFSTGLVAESSKNTKLKLRKVALAKVSGVVAIGAKAALISAA